MIGWRLLGGVPCLFGMAYRWFHPVDSTQKCVAAIWLWGLLELLWADDGGEFRVRQVWMFNRAKFV